ncbi:MAG: Rap1a/Tai family immunity protein [Pseudomonadota bacterium]
MRTFMRFNTLAAAILILGGVTLDARAESLNGAELLALCDTPKSDSMVYFTNFSLCAGYINGVSDASMCGNVVGGSSHANPDGATVANIFDVFVTWMRNHPDHASEGASVLVARSLAESYPCS